LRLVEVIAERVEPAPFASVGNVQMEVEYAEAALRLAAAAVAAAGKPVKVETAILQGDPAATLIAESRNAEMVCVGSVGTGRLAKALLGSTAAACRSCPLSSRDHPQSADSAEA
jgi:nucleotide-binding universal stress UspA family protein